MDSDNVSRLRSVIAKLSRQLNASASDEGLTPSQASALTLIAHRGPISLTELSALEGLNPTMLSRIVGKLDDARLIRRVTNPADQRMASVEITSTGLEVDELIRNRRVKIVSDCVAVLASDQQLALVEALPALEELARELSARAQVGG